jgi:hypothetical protein
MALEVIGAGFGRTGTTSLKAALEQLGFSKCHHMQEVPRAPKQVAFWQSLADGAEPASAHWEAAFEGYRASCDWPSCTYWEDLARVYPEAKIILTVRDEERWYQSCLETIYAFSYTVPAWLARAIPPFYRFNRMIRSGIWEGTTFGGRFLDREYALKVYREHNAYVKANVPPERLLVFEAKDGWEPLCRFLDVPVPKGAYPHLNDAAQIKRALSILRGVGWLAVAGIATALLSGVVRLFS